MCVLKYGDSDKDVRRLQKLLIANGYDVKLNGAFNEETERAVEVFQEDHRLVCDGVVGPKTWAALSGAPLPKTLCQRDIEKAAALLSVEVPVIQAVNAVESSGCGFLDSGMPKILYERHIMYRQLKSHGQKADEWARGIPALVSTLPGGYRGGANEWIRLRDAERIHEKAARESCSWGAFQIMGWHWSRLGYSSIDEFVDCMRRSEGYHLDAFVRFIMADPNLTRALRQHDWATFAHGYNGKDYRKHAYDTKLALAYQRYAAKGTGEAPFSKPVQATY
ncbi:N-acetylmuramidase domain-containing protein [Phytohalomonas tamaricis]|uniref:N-acetylmuramidase domain-containing protein n=1 Tax=Phytohalomonas tamaricis TaxID=2081032 RepID=UPI000D0B271C|nr:N-acetylmuramidase family protein [Phytohalomonas tamaricis]